MLLNRTDPRLDVIDPLDLIEIPGVHRIHQQVAQQPLRRWPPEFRDHQPGRAPAVPPAHLSHVSRAPPQVVQVPVRRPRKAPEALVIEHSKRPRGDLSYGTMKTSAVGSIGTSAQARSVVRMGAPSAMPRARQAWSPSDSPKGRVTSRRAPAMSANSVSNSRTSKPRPDRISSASWLSTPWSLSFAATSERLTEDPTACANYRSTMTEPGSRYSTASRAEASRTALGIARFPASLGPSVFD